MVRNRVKKFRGSRTCGGGTHKNRRGAGNRGGRGNAGRDKHHFVRAFLRGDRFGKKGFKMPPSKQRDVSVMNVCRLDAEIEKFVDKGLARREGDGRIYVNLSDIGVDKLLGGGRVSSKLVVSGGVCSEKARAKLESSGGSVEAVEA